MGVTEGTSPGRADRIVLAAAAISTVTAWIAFMLWIPAIVWAEHPTPFGLILGNAPRVGQITAPMALLVVLLAAYLALAWVAWRAQADLPALLVLGTFAVSGLCAALTYSLFANDIYVVLANVWTLLGPRSNPYEAPPLWAMVGTTVNPYIVYAGNWAA